MQGNNILHPNYKANKETKTVEVRTISSFTRKSIFYVPDVFKHIAVEYSQRSPNHAQD